MDQELLRKLKEWRMIKARQENVPAFRVFVDKTLEGIAALRPKNKDELLTIKGMGERKFERYGREILEMIGGNDGPITGLFCDASRNGETGNDKKKPYTVSGYLDLLNKELRKREARVQGEISSLDIRDNYLFFSLKDKNDESLLSCFMWMNNYKLCGVSFEEGLEIIVEGFPEVYKPNGRLSFRVSSAELVGEGALKKAYEQLKKRLEDEGLFLPERKKPIPEFVQRIGLITSETGAVIHDFLNNLGQYGYQIKFFSSRVEGQAAVKDLLSAIEYFEDKDIEVLVIIRGGGSLESLQAFNNEFLARKIADFKTPVICGIGHEKDVPLASLAADLMVSTPTAVTVVLNKPWERALDNIKTFERVIVHQYQEALEERKHRLELLTGELRQKADFIFKRFELLKQQLINKLEMIEYI
ncbi:MAG TPA: exodeoxyribonuclease VII large subunit, partial [Candidatus Parcubacteria bacterium]|nr:exodeoxyribonuclease VII large subunit [Candidatus Parcubacteria bacterium]